MQRGLIILLTTTLLFLTGCATTIQSDVTVFHEWPTDLRDKSFVFERTKEQENNLEYRSYENLVRSELLRLGFAEAAGLRSAKLKVSMFFNMQVRDVRVVQPVAVDPWYGGPFGYPFYAPPFYGPRWQRYGYYSPFYDPFWYGPPITTQQESNFQLFTRQLRVWIAQVADSKKIFDVAVISEGRNGSLAAIMPYMVRSAFADFPGTSGVPRRVEMKMKD